MFYEELCLDFIDDNGNCITFCDTVLNNIVRNQGFEDKCEPKCPSNEYLLPDGTCVTSCLPPMIKTTSGSPLLCNPPCDPNGSNPFFNHED